MKKLLYLFLAICVSSVSFGQTTLIPDPNFEQALIDLGYDTPPIDGSVPTNNIWSIFELDISNRAITDLTGIEDFGALSILDCSLNALVNLDMSDNWELIYLNCSANQLINLELPEDGGLFELNCAGNQLINLDTGNSNYLNTLNCGNNQLTSLDLTNNPLLEILNCSANQLTSLDVINNPQLIELYVFLNPLTNLDVSSNSNLEVVDCADTNLEILDVSNNTMLKLLRCTNINNSGQLTSLDVSNNLALEFFTFRGNQLTDIDVSNNTELYYLNGSANQLASINVANNPLLRNFYVYENQLTSLDVSNNPLLLMFWCYSNQLTTLDVRNGNNTNITGADRFNSMDNPNLTCIYVDDVEYSSQNWINIDPNSTFVENEAECEALAVGDDSLDDLVLYPSPTDNYLFIQGTVGQFSTTVYNMLGKQVLFAENTYKIDVSGLSDGVYIINLSDGVNETQRKFIKN